MNRYLFIVLFTGILFLYHPSVAQTATSIKEIKKKLELADSLAFSDAGRAYRHAFAALLAARKASNDSLTGISLNVLGIIKGVQSENDSATLYFMKALEIFERLGNLKSQSGTLSNMARIIMVEGRSSEALEYLRKAARLDQILGDEHALISDYQNMGNVYNRINQTDSALVYLRKSESIAKALKDEKALASARYNLSNTFIRLDSLSRALVLLEQIEPFFRKDNNEVALIMILYNKARIAFERLQYNEAIACLQEALGRSKEEGLAEQESKILELLSSAYEATGDYKRALEAHAAYKSVSDTILNKEKSAIIARLQYQYETRKKEEEIRTLHQEARSRRLITWVAVTTALAGLFFAVVLYLSKKLQAQQYAKQALLLQGEKEKAALAHRLEEQEKLRLEAENVLKEAHNRQLRHDLENNQRELATTTIHIHQKNKMLEELRAEIQALSNKVGDNHRQQLHDISRNLKNHLSFEDDWEKLKMHFEKVHPGFFVKLKNLCPDLTMNELKQCAYIKINLTNKEVANMMNIDTASVKMSRYRIKKKLRMDPDASLTEFILSV